MFLTTSIFTWVVYDNVINFVKYYAGYCLSGGKDYSVLGQGSEKDRFSGEHLLTNDARAQGYTQAEG